MIKDKLLYVKNIFKNLKIYLYFLNKYLYFLNKYLFYKACKIVFKNCFSKFSSKSVVKTSLCN